MIAGFIPKGKEKVKITNVVLSPPPCGFKETTSPAAT